MRHPATTPRIRPSQARTARDAQPSSPGRARGGRAQHPLQPRTDVVRRAATLARAKRARAPRDAGRAAQGHERRGTVAQVWPVQMVVVGISKDTLQAHMCAAQARSGRADPPTRSVPSAIPGRLTPRCSCGRRVNTRPVAVAYFSTGVDSSPHPAGRSRMHERTRRCERGRRRRASRPAPSVPPSGWTPPRPESGTARLRAARPLAASPSQDSQRPGEAATSAGRLSALRSLAALGVLSSRPSRRPAIAVPEKCSTSVRGVGPDASPDRYGCPTELRQDRGSLSPWRIPDRTGATPRNARRAVADGEPRRRAGSPRRTPGTVGRRRSSVRPRRRFAVTPHQSRAPT
jgi:hypothetical protein